MALTSTIGTFFLPFADPSGAVTPRKVEALQTTVSGSTAGTFLIGTSATASGDTYLVGLNVTIKDGTSTAAIDVMFDEVTIGSFAAFGATTPVSNLGTQSFYFGEIGLKGGTTTTNSVYLNCKTATSTVQAVCRFNRLV